MNWLQQNVAIVHHTVHLQYLSIVLKFLVVSVDTTQCGKLFRAITTLFHIPCSTVGPGLLSSLEAQAAEWAQTPSPSKAQHYARTLKD